MKLKNLAVLIIAAIMTVMLYALGATVYSADTDDENSSLADSHDDSHSGWEPLHSGENFPTKEGHYILMGDEDVVSLKTYGSASLRITAAVDICLNGHTLDVYGEGSAGYISVGNNGTLSICNHGSEEGKITTNYADVYGCIYLFNGNAALNIMGTNITIGNSEIRRGIYNNGGKINIEGDSQADDITIIGGEAGIFTNTFTSNPVDIKNATVEASGIGYETNYGIYSSGYLNITNSKVSGVSCGIHLNHGTNRIISEAHIIGTTVDASADNGVGISCPSGQNALDNTKLYIEGCDKDGTIYGSHIYGNTAIECGGTTDITLISGTVGGRLTENGATDTGEYGIKYEVGSSGGSITIPAEAKTSVFIKDVNTGIDSQNANVTVLSGDITAETCGIKIDGGTLTVGNGSYDIEAGSESKEAVTTPNIYGGRNGVRIASAGTVFNLSGHPNINCNDDIKNVPDEVADIYLAGTTATDNVNDSMYAYITIVAPLDNLIPYTVYTEGGSCIFTNTKDIYAEGESEDEGDEPLYTKEELNDEDKFEPARSENFKCAINKINELGVGEADSHLHQLKFGKAIVATFNYNDGKTYGSSEEDQDDDDEDGVQNITMYTNKLESGIPYAEGDLPAPYEYSEDENISESIKGFYWPEHEFLGWFTSASDGQQVSIGSTLVPDVDTILYAHWKTCEHSEWQYTDKNASTHTKVCKECRYEVTESHTFVDDEARTESDHTLKIADCEEGGEKWLICECKTDKKEPTDPLGHDLKDDWHSVEGDNEYHWRECHRDGCTYGEDGKAYTESQAHKPREGSTDHKDPTCTTPGYDSYSCEVCGNEVKTELSTVSHEYSGGYLEVESYDDEHHWIKCRWYDECKTTQEEDHKWSDWQTLTEPDCRNGGTDGLRKRTCECGAFQTEAIPSEVAHDFSGAYQHNGDKHWKLCTKCGEAPKEEDWQLHSWTEDKSRAVEPNCSTGALGKKVETCVCGAEHTTDVPAEHKYDNWVPDETEPESGHWHVCVNVNNGKTCGAIEADSLKPHTPGTGQPLDKPAEQGKIWKQYTCTLCGYQWEQLEDNEPEPTLPSEDSSDPSSPTESSSSDTDPDDGDDDNDKKEEETTTQTVATDPAVPDEPGGDDSDDKDPENSDSDDSTSESEDPENSDSDNSTSKSEEPENSDSDNSSSKSEEPENSEPDNSSSKSEDPENSEPDNSSSKSEDPENSDPNNSSSKSEDPENSDPDNSSNKPEVPDNTDTQSGTTTEPSNTKPSDDPTTRPPKGDDDDNGDDDEGDESDTTTPNSTSVPDPASTSSTSKTTTPTTRPPVTSTSATEPTQPSPDSGSETSASSTDPDSTGSDIGSGTGTSSTDPTSPDDPDNSGTGTGSGDDISPDPDVTTPPATDPGSGKVIVGVESEEGAPDISIDPDSAKSLEQEVIEKHITDEEKAEMEGGVNMEIILRVIGLNIDDSVSAEDKDLMEAFMNNSTYNLGEYLDISVIKLMNGQQIGRITRLDDPISITLEIPEALRGQNRSFAVVRLHSGSADLLYDLDSDPDTITIESDRFSTYVIVYRDSAEGEKPDSGTNSVNGNPNTGSPLTGLTVLAVVLPIGVLAAVFNKNREK